MEEKKEQIEQNISNNKDLQKDLKKEKEEQQAQQTQDKEVQQEQNSENTEEAPKKFRYKKSQKGKTKLRQANSYYKEQQQQKNEKKQIEGSIQENGNEENQGVNNQHHKKSIFLKRFTIKNLRQKLKKIRENDDFDEQFVKDTLLTQEGLQALKKLEEFPNDEQVQKLKHICSYYITKYNQVASLKLINDEMRSIQQDQQAVVRQIDNSFAPSIGWFKYPKYIIPDFVNYTLYYQIKKRNWEQVAQKVKFLRRKRRQLEFFVEILREIIEKRKKEGKEVKRIVDFAGGRGDLAMLIGYVFPDIKVTVIDIKIETITLAKYRIRQMGMKNMSAVLGDIRDYQEEFDMAIGLHACGGLTDIILEKCQQQKVLPGILICTCCFGKLKLFQDTIQYPKYVNNIDKEKYLQIGDYAETDSIVKICDEFFDSKNTCNVDVSKDDLLQKCQINQDICQNSFDLNSIKDFPSYCRRYVNNDRIAAFNQIIQKKYPQDAHKKPYILQIPSEYTLRNQFLVLE